MCSTDFDDVVVSDSLSDSSESKVVFECKASSLFDVSNFVVGCCGTFAFLLDGMNMEVIEPKDWDALDRDGSKFLSTACKVFFNS